MNKKPRNLPVSETNHSSLWEWEESSLQMSSVSSRSCRHQTLWNNDFVSELVLLYFQYFCSTQYSLYHASNMINISGMKMPGCILLEEFLIIGGILRLWWQCCTNAKHFPKGLLENINSAFSCVCSLWHFGVKLFPWWACFQRASSLLQCRSVSSLSL